MADTDGVRVVIVLTVVVLGLMQSAGILVVHDHPVGNADHGHAFIVDDDGHAGHAEDTRPNDAGHPSPTQTTRAGGMTTVLILGFTVLGLLTTVVSRPQGSAALIGDEPRAVPIRGRLALLTVLRV